MRPEGSRWSIGARDVIEFFTDRLEKSLQGLAVARMRSFRGYQRRLVRLLSFSLRLDIRQQTPEKAKGERWRSPRCIKN